MNAKVIASENPAAVSTWRTCLVRAMAGSGGGCGASSGWERYRQPIEPVVPANLFHEVGLARDVHAEARHRDLPPFAAAGGFCRDAEPERLEYSRNICWRNVLTEQSLDPFGPERHAYSRPRRRVAIDECADRPACLDFLEQRCRAGDTYRRRRDVASTFEADRGFGLEAQSLARATDRGWLKIRALQRHARRSGTDFRASTAHDAANRRGVIRVGDDEHLLVQLSLDPVERLECFFLARPADNQASTSQTIEIERVHRLTELEHHVVGHVDDVVDGPDTSRLESLGQPARGRADTNIEDLRAVSRTELRILDGDADVGLTADRVERRQRRRRHGQVPDNGCLPGDAEVIHAVGPVGGDFEVDDRDGAVVDGGDLEPAQRNLGSDPLRFARNGHQLGQPRKNDLSQRKLLQEAQVVFVEQPDVLDTPLEQGHSFDAHAERKTGVSLRVVADRLEHGRVDHPAAENLEPAATLADSALRRRSRRTPHS